MAKPEKNIVYCCPWRPGYRESYPAYSTRVAKWISLQYSTQSLAKPLETSCVCYFLFLFFFSLLIEMGKWKRSWSPLIITMLSSFQACAPKGLLGHSQKANGAEPAYSKTLFLFFLTLIAQMLPVTGLLQIIHCWSKYSWCLWCIKNWMLKSATSHCTEAELAKSENISDTSFIVTAQKSPHILQMMISI